jgi:hypothetical protein
LSVGPSLKSLETKPGTGHADLSQLKCRSGSDQNDFGTGKQETSAISGLKACSCFIVESKSQVVITTIEAAIDITRWQKIHFPIRELGSGSAHSQIGRIDLPLNIS